MPPIVEGKMMTVRAFTYIRSGHGRGMVPFHLLLATYDAVRVQESDPRQRRGDGPIPVNTLYTEPQALFADPLHPPASASKLMTTGVNRDTLLTTGWLELNKEPQVLHVPDMAGRYYSIQFTDPSKNTNFAYVGKRTTGTQQATISLQARAGKDRCRPA